MSSSNNHEEKRDRNSINKKEIKNIIKDSQITGNHNHVIRSNNSNKIKIKIGYSKRQKTLGS